MKMMMMMMIDEDDNNGKIIVLCLHANYLALLHFHAYHIHCGYLEVSERVHVPYVVTSNLSFQVSLN